MSAPGRPKRESSLGEAVAQRLEGSASGAPGRPKRESSLGEAVAKRLEGSASGTPGRPKRESSLGEAVAQRLEGSASGAPGLRVRQLARAGQWAGTTRGSAPGMLQCNVVVLPQSEAEAFGEWCERNADIAPVVARTEPGNPVLPELGEDVDLRLDLPAYRLFEHGQAVGEVADLRAVWRDDLVGFAFGCSFSLEDALRAGGIPLDYEERGFGGAIYVTSRESQPHRHYGGPLVVSMRPIRQEWVASTLELCARYPQLHGAPVHAGDPAALGIVLNQPLQSLGPLSVAPGEVPVFWACGVTTQYVIEQARPAWAASHVSARMLVTDVPIEALRRG